MLAIILIPGVIAAILIAPYLLRVFGPQYSDGGTVIFQLLAVSTFLIAANFIGNTIMNIERRNGGVAVVACVIAVVTLAIALPLMRFGLVGVGLAMLIGNFSGNVVQVILLAARRPSDKPHGQKIMPAKAAIQSIIASYKLGETEVGQNLSLEGAAVYVVTAGSHKYVLKIYNSSDRTMGELKEELQFMHALSQKGVPSPEIVASASGPISELKIEKTTWLSVLAKYETGTRLDPSDPALLRNMAFLQGKMHTVGIEYAAQHGPGTLNVKAGSLRSTLIGYVPKGMSHFDYTDSNILVKGNRTLCITDFDSARYDPLVVCLFYTLTSLHRALASSEVLESYVKAYQTVRKLSWSERLTLRIALALRYRSVRMLSLGF